VNIVKVIKHILLGVSVVATGFSAEAQRFHCEADTAKAMEIIREFYNPGGDPAKICGPIAEKLKGVAYVPISKEDSIGVAEIRLDGFDDFAFVNMVAALAKTATSPGYSRPKDLEIMLEKLTFRRGEANGFPTRMMYGGDWIVDNRSRGNVKELTEDYSEHFKTKSLDWVCRHRGEFAALKDSATYERQRMVEFGYRTFKIPHMKRESSDWKQVNPDIQDGDLIMLLTPEPDRDVWEMGYVVRRDDGLHFIHASERDGKVVEESEPLGRYIKRHSKEVYGWRWLRIL
jgi:hypothetical protein